MKRLLDNLRDYALGMGFFSGGMVLALGIVTLIVVVGSWS